MQELVLNLQSPWVTVLCAGLGFFLLEHVCIFLVKPWIVRQLKAAGNSKKAEGIATQAITRILGALHNLVQVPLALYLLWDPKLAGNHLTGVTPLSLLMVQISAGFFVHDLCVCVTRFHLEGPLYLLHAVVCCSCYVYGTITGYLHYYGAAFLLWECSTPFVHMRWFLYKLGWEKKAVYTANGLAMVLSFFLCRIAWGYYIAYQFSLELIGELGKPGGLHFVVVYALCAALVAMTCLNSYWFTMMAKRAAQVLLGIKGDVKLEKAE